jgi:antitoxin YefM
MVFILTIIKNKGGGSMQMIETYVPITQAKTRLLDMVRQLHDTNNTIAITKNGVPEAVLLSMKTFDGLLETIDVLADPAMMSQLHESSQDIKSGKLIDFDEAF